MRKNEIKFKIMRKTERFAEKLKEIGIYFKFKQKKP